MSWLLLSPVPPSSTIVVAGAHGFWYVGDSVESRIRHTLTGDDGESQRRAASDEAV